MSNAFDWRHCPRCASLGRESWHHISKFYEDRREPGRYRPNCKQCDKEKRKEKYRNNKDKELKKIKEYDKANKETIRSYQQKYQLLYQRKNGRLYQKEYYKRRKRQNQ